MMDMGIFGFGFWGNDGVAVVDSRLLPLGNVG